MMDSDEIFRIANQNLEQPVVWYCDKCGQKHFETEGRNFLRRKYKCSCEQLALDKTKKENKLLKQGFCLIDYQISSTGTAIDVKKPIKVQCCNCGKVFISYYYNILKQWKKCDCNSKKDFTRDLSSSEFVDKWTTWNKTHYSLLDDEYHGRNYKYSVQCNHCGFKQVKWGISLIDQDCLCQNCQSSIGEIKIAEWLTNNKIDYDKQYRVYFNEHLHIFDFFIPLHSTFIEYNGAQHYYPVEWFGGEKEFQKRQIRDKEKTQYCLQNNYHFIVISYMDDIEEKLATGLKFND